MKLTYASIQGCRSGGSCADPSTQGHSDHRVARRLPVCRRTACESRCCCRRPRHSLPKRARIPYSGNRTYCTGTWILFLLVRKKQVRGRERKDFSRIRRIGDAKRGGKKREESARFCCSIIQKDARLLAFQSVESASEQPETWKDITTRM